MPLGAVVDEFPVDQPADVEGARSLLACIPDDLRDELTVEVLGLAEDFGRGTLEPLALKCGLTADEISVELKKAEIGDRRKTLIAKLVPHAMAELGFDPKVSAVGALGFFLGVPVARFGYSWVTLARIAKERNQRPPQPAEPAPE